MRNKLQKNNPSISGDLLISEFQSALTNLVTMDTAAAEAQYSEENVENALRYQAPQNGVYLTAGELDPAIADTLVRNSVDAHLKKVQAEQIKNFTASQLDKQQSDVEIAYKGRKVKISLLTDSKDVFIPIFADSRMGGLREGTYRGNTITGTIEEIALEKNLLIIKPTWLWRKIVPERRYFLVVVINIQTLTPNIQVEML